MWRPGVGWHEVEGCCMVEAAKMCIKFESLLCCTHFALQRMMANIHFVALFHFIV